MYLFCKIVFASLLFSGVLHADNYAVDDGQIGVSVLSELNSYSKIDKKNGNVAKAQLYEFGYPKENIKPDINKALQYYKKAFDEGSAIAAFKLGMASWSAKKLLDKNSTKDKFVNDVPLYYFSEGALLEPEEAANINGIAAGIYLYTEEKYKDAKEFLSIYADKHYSTAELYVAFIEKIEGNIGLANQYLTRACKNRKITEDVKQFCYGSDVNRVNLDTGAILKGKSNNSSNQIKGCPTP